MPTPIANAGLYGAGAKLPTDPGPIEPPILFTGPTPAPSPNPTWNPAWNNNDGSMSQPGYYISGFGNNYGLGNDLYSSLASLNYGNGYGSYGTYNGDPSGAGMVSSTLFGNNSGNNYAGGSASQPGYDIAGFGNSGLGNDLYASLDSMNYGNGYGGYNAGGTSQPGYDIAGFGGSPALGSDLFTSLDSMGYGGGATAPNYPAPGTGAPPPPQQSIGSRLFHNIPAVRIGSAIVNALRPRPDWRQNAASTTPFVQPSVPTGGALLGYRPSQGGGLQHWDPATGRVTGTPSLNPLYTTGNGWQPVANAPVDLRFSQNSGTGNWQADQTTKNFLAGGGYQGAPNQAGPDSTNRFYGKARSVDSQGGYSPAQPAADFNPADMAAKTALYNQAVQSLPYQQGEGGASYTRRVNDWIAQRNGSQSIQTLLAKLYPNGTGTISGPPVLPGGG